MEYADLLVFLVQVNLGYLGISIAIVLASLAMFSFFHIRPHIQKLEKLEERAAQQEKDISRFANELYHLHTAYTQLITLREQKNNSEKLSMTDAEMEEEIIRLTKLIKELTESLE